MASMGGKGMGAETETEGRALARSSESAAGSDKGQARVRGPCVERGGLARRPRAVFRECDALPLFLCVLRELRVLFLGHSNSGTQRAHK